MAVFPASWDLLPSRNLEDQSKTQNLETKDGVEKFAPHFPDFEETGKESICKYLDSAGVEHIRVYRRASETDELWSLLSVEEGGVPLELFET